LVFDIINTPAARRSNLQPCAVIDRNRLIAKGVCLNTADDRRSLQIIEP